jgi:hypothetical protein
MDDTAVCSCWIFTIPKKTSLIGHTIDLNWTTPVCNVLISAEAQMFLFWLLPGKLIWKVNIWHLPFMIFAGTFYSDVLAWLMNRIIWQFIGRLVHIRSWRLTCKIFMHHRYTVTESKEDVRDTECWRSLFLPQLLFQQKDIWAVIVIGMERQWECETLSKWARIVN